MAKEKGPYQILQIAQKFVRSRLSGTTLVHTLRVALFDARELCFKELSADDTIVEMAGLFHDIEKDSVPFEQHASAAAITFRNFAQGFPELTQDWIDAVTHCIEAHVSAWVGDGPKPQTIEAKIISDADMLQQLSAFGLVKHMEKHRQLPFADRLNQTLQDLKRAREVIVTKSAKKIAAQRWKYVKEFIENAKIGR